MGLDTTTSKNFAKPHGHGSLCVLIGPLLLLIVGSLVGCGSGSDEDDVIPAIDAIPSVDDRSVAPERDLPPVPKTDANDDSSNTTPTRRAVDLDTANASQLREVALKALEAGQDDLAFDVVRRAVRRAPDNPEITYLHAMILADRNRFREAVVLLDELAEKVPQSRLPFLGQSAEWMAEAGEFADAESRYRKILSSLPDEPQVHHYLGQLLLQLGRRSESATHFRFLARLGDLNQEELRSLLRGRCAFRDDEDEGRLTPLSDLAIARQALGDDDPARALELLEETQQPLEQSLRARIHANQKRWDLVRQWKPSFAQRPFDADGWFAIAALDLEDGNVERALASVARAILIDPTDDEAYALLAIAAKRGGQPEVAKRADTRSQQLQQTARLGASIVGDQRQNRQRVGELIDLLKRLNRPLEVFGWRSVDLVYGVQDRSLSELQAQQAFAAIGQEREQFLGGGGQPADRDFLLCGLRLSDPPVNDAAAGDAGAVDAAKP